MNIIEAGKKENIGKSYEVFIDGWSTGVWELKKGLFTEEFEFYKEGEPLTGKYYVSELIKMEFEEFFDWSKVKVDTKLLVSRNGEDWYRRYFAKYENGKVYCFDSGTTSFSVKDSNFDINPWGYVKLYEE